ncbi:hypothetical protein [Neobacillus rhizosphaerae]|nr:hypothetical protein [Neobacillus rhizosphaerae]
MQCQNIFFKSYRITIQYEQSQALQALFFQNIEYCYSTYYNTFEQSFDFLEKNLSALESEQQVTCFMWLPENRSSNPNRIFLYYFAVSLQR